MTMNEDYTRGFPVDFDFDAAIVALPTATPVELLAMLSTWIDGAMVADPATLSAVADKVAPMIAGLQSWIAEYQQAQQGRQGI
jgi:hypothetical protein